MADNPFEIPQTLRDVSEQNLRTKSLRDSSLLRGR